MDKHTRAQQNATYFGSSSTPRAKRQLTRDEQNHAAGRRVFGSVILAGLGVYLTLNGLRGGLDGWEIFLRQLFALVSFTLSYFCYQGTKNIPRETVQSLGVKPASPVEKASSNLFDGALDRWYARYPMAVFYGVVMWGCWAIYQSERGPSDPVFYLNTHPAMIFVGGFFLVSLLAAIYCAREVLLVLVVLAIIIALGLLIATLPIPVAIVVGACIIAGMIFYTRRKA